MLARVVSWSTKRDRDFWSLVNHVIDRITLPSAKVFVGMYPGHEVPLCWAVTRDGELLYTYVRKGIVNDAALAGELLKMFLGGLPVVAIKVRDFNPFRELERT
jgi:hypothetical protein